MAYVIIKRKRHGGNICPECLHESVCKYKSATITGCSGFEDLPAAFVPPLSMIEDTVTADEMLAIAREVFEEADHATD